ncbi:hypothetical protein Scep_007139 [Stephania cephalantha]|uniref:Reverse transcriptase domain-containing protein n=1 Tax=Stephania cephalantha TaxID=152367 RepID=A0AAP0KBV5_9MAGN
MWLEVSSCIRRVGSNVLGISKGLGPPKKETWWWNEDVQRAIKTKREMYRKIPKCQDEDVYNQYREARKQAKKVVSQAKTNFMEDLYTRLGNRDGEKYIYRLAKLRDKQKQDLSHVRCIKDENQNVLTREEDIKERWRSYFDSLFNDSQVDTIIDENPHQERNVNYTRNIGIVEVKEALKRMKIGKACGPDEIPIEVWKCLGEIGLTWLTKLFNKILKSKRMPMDWRRSTLVPIFKNKGDIQSCSNYRGIKLMSHTMKLWERIIDNRLRRETTISENQFGFMPGRSTMEAIFLVRRLLEKYRENKKDLHMVFVDLEKAYDRVPRDVLWWVLERKRVHARYIDTIKDMYDGVVTSIKTFGGATKEFPITIGLHQGSALSPYLFTLVIDELTRHIQEDIPWCMLFAR